MTMIQDSSSLNIQQKGHSSLASLLGFSNHTKDLCNYILCVLLMFICVSPGVSQSQMVQDQQWPTTTWSETNPEDVGMNPAALKEAEEIYPLLFPSGYSLLVIRKGYLVSESYFHDQTAQTSNHVYSVTKTFVATLLAISIQQGWIDGIDQRVADLLPELSVHPKLAELTLEDVLTHRSGVGSNSSFSDVSLLLQAEPKSIPGTTFEYSNYAPHILTTILDRQTKLGLAGAASDVPAFAKEHLFDPLGINISEWKKLPSGVPEGANGMYTTSRDLARLGYLLLRDGYWEGKQLLPTGWVQAASENQVEFDRQKGYGYLNWVRRRPDMILTESGEQEVHGYFAYGHRGQFIGVYPELDLLIVTNADATDATRDTYFVPDLLHDFVRRFIFSAVIQPDSTSLEK